MKHKGACHCGAVRFEFEAAADVTVHLCNCSMCELVAYQHLIIPLDQFRLLSDESNLSLYTFNTGIAKHFFCSTCGIKSWYVPRSNPDGVSVNFRCVAKDTISSSRFVHFDGQNWEANSSALAYLSESKK